MRYLLLLLLPVSALAQTVSVPLPNTKVVIEIPAPAAASLIASLPATQAVALQREIAAMKLQKVNEGLTAVIESVRPGIKYLTEDEINYFGAALKKLAAEAQEKILTRSVDAAAVLREKEAAAAAAKQASIEASLESTAIRIDE